uniref:Neurotransmitter-gated ion-channel ligand-binding domain-containing protein n=1 Tax=Stomoxys calcitrans TaxID=35570 RepID=A0A1I8PR10_STOCA
MQIIDVDEKNQLLITNIWLKLEWNDMNLRWNASDYGGVRDLRIPPHRLWKPDVLMYNSADEGFDGTYATNVVVRNNGSCLYVPPGIFKSTCKIDITWFPFDDQRCEMKFGSWTYDGFQLDLQLQDEAGGDISSFITNGEWDLLGMLTNEKRFYLHFMSLFSKIDITWFPFDDQRCEMKFGSWTYDGFQLDLQLQDEAGGDISSFITNGEWDLLGMLTNEKRFYLHFMSLFS